MLPSQDDIAQAAPHIGLMPLVRMKLPLWQLISPIDLTDTQTGGLRVAGGVVVDSGRV
jgi:hypothetical protein